MTGPQVAVLGLHRRTRKQLEHWSASVSLTYLSSKATKSTEEDVRLGHSMHCTVTEDIPLTTALGGWEGSRVCSEECGRGHMHVLRSV